MENIGTDKLIRDLSRTLLLGRYIGNSLIVIVAAIVGVLQVKGLLASNVGWLLLGSILVTTIWASIWLQRTKMYAQVVTART